MTNSQGNPGNPGKVKKSIQWSVKLGKNHEMFGWLEEMRLLSKKC